ncbi:hypothetical protein ACJIZ3_019393 [Penstemon smallii]|uniref:Uncharacterized protein n=1 Tax=Penstemon smallii TaxID=265156 RepID=A0ABD3T1W3_9LAMI
MANKFLSFLSIGKTAYAIQPLLLQNFKQSTKNQRKAEMVTIVVATTADPASINPAKALLSMPDWHPGPTLDGGIRSFTNGGTVRLLELDSSIIKEDDLDLRWEFATGETVDELIFLSKHVAVSSRPSLTIHPIDGDVLPQGGRPGWAAPPCPRIGPWLILLKKIAESHNLLPEFEITLEATHHGPITTKPAMFVEIGSTDEYWGRQDAAQVIALVEYKFIFHTILALLFMSLFFANSLTKFIGIYTMYIKKEIICNSLSLSLSLSMCSCV